MFKKRIASFIAAAAVTAASIPFLPTVMTEHSELYAVYAEDGCTVPEVNMEYKSISDLDCFRFTAAMGTGYNLGNTFDAIDDNAPEGEANLYLESSWVGVKTTEATIDAIKEAGFDTLRIPVSWHNHVDSAFNINTEWLNRVQEIVDYALSKDMYVILNIHHDNEKEYMFPDYDYLDSSKKYVTAIWSQLAAHFKNYDEHLVFETLNEPRMIGSNYEWWYTSSSAECKEAQDCINQYNQAAVDAIRAAGGENSDRYIMVPAYCAKTEAAITNEFKLPEDSAENRLILSVHEYIPYDFAMSGADDSGSVTAFDMNGSQAAEISNLMDTLYVKFISNNIPVVIGEFGARNKNENTQARVDYAAYYYAAARARGITCCWWDNNCFGTYEGEAFGLLDRATNTWIYDSIAEAADRYGDGAATNFSGTGNSGNENQGDGTILPDGTVLFDSGIGDELVLTIEKSDDCAGGGGCLEFMVALNGVNYWVAYAWDTTSGNGIYTVDMTAPTKVCDTSRTDANGDSVVIEDEALIAQIAGVAMKNSSTKIQYWWACDPDWNNYASADGYLTVTSVTRSHPMETEDPADPANPTEPSAEPAENTGEILPDGTILFDTAIGDEIVLTIQKASGVAGGGGCLEFNIPLNGVDYWVAYEWYTPDGGTAFTVDMTSPSQVNDTTNIDENGDAVPVMDTALIAQLAELAMQSTSATIQYWWACDSSWNPLAAAEGNITITAAVLTNPGETVTADVVYGDVDLDGEVSIVDVIALSQSLMGSGTLTADQQVCADVNRDKVINSSDCLNIIKYIVRLIDTLPVEQG